MRKLLLVKTMKRKGRNSSFESTFYSPIRESTGLGITGIVHGYILYKSLEMKKSRKEVIFFNKNLEFHIYVYIFAHYYWLKWSNLRYSLGRFVKIFENLFRYEKNMFIW